MVGFGGCFGLVWLALGFYVVVLVCYFFLKGITPEKCMRSFKVQHKPKPIPLKEGIQYLGVRKKWKKNKNYRNKHFIVPGESTNFKMSPYFQYSLVHILFNGAFCERFHYFGHLENN